MNDLLAKRDAFLNHFSELSSGQLGALANYFLKPYRERGVTDPTLICRYVYADVLRMLRNMDDNRRRGWEVSEERYRSLYSLLRTMKEHREDALLMAEWAVEWDQLEPYQKDQIRAPRRQQYMREHMALKSATEKQLSLLRSLGYEGEVESRLHAHDLIDSLINSPSAT